MLTVENVKLIISSGRPDWIAKAEIESRKYSVHINGQGVAEYLTPNEGWENDQQMKARKQLVTSNRFLFENLTRPIDKVFSATGGNNVYPKKNKNKLLSTISNIRHGYSVKKWIQNIQANKYYTDPNGLVFFEWDKEITYPTIKTIDNILNYSTDGRDVQWIVFMPEIIKGKNNKEEGKYFRVVDEKFDYTYKQKGEELTLIKEKTFKNPFGKCPAIVNSDIVHFDLDRKDSPFAPVIELADHYLRTGSISNIAENYHGYPIFWAYGRPCVKCHGEGSERIGDEIVKCSSCDGTGTSIKKDVTTGIFLKPPVDNNEVKLAPDLAGYVSPDIDSLKALRESLDELWQQIHFTTWGTSYQRDQQTATATWIDAQPVNERLSKFSESFEDMEQKMTELIALFINGSANDISINWGKRFMIESPDVIWKKYSDARAAGSPKTTLDYLLSQFYQSEYSNDAESLITSTKLMKLEPFIHLTEKEVKDMGITGRDLTAKLYYNEWVKTLEEGYVFITDLKKLKTEFEAFVDEKQKYIDETKPKKEIINPGEEPESNN